MTKGSLMERCEATPGANLAIAGGVLFNNPSDLPAASHLPLHRGGFDEVSRRATS